MADRLSGSFTSIRLFYQIGGVLTTPGAASFNESLPEAKYIPVIPVVEQQQQKKKSCPEGYFYYNNQSSD